MTPKEAIERLKELSDGALLNIETPYLPPYLSAIRAAITALEDQIPKRIKIINGDDICPSCGYVFGPDSVRRGLLHWEMPRCKRCGQALDWRADDGKEVH